MSIDSMSTVCPPTVLCVHLQPETADQSAECTEAQLYSTTRIALFTRSAILGSIVSVDLNHLWLWSGLGIGCGFTTVRHLRGVTASPPSFPGRGSPYTRPAVFGGSNEQCWDCINASILFHSKKAVLKYYTHDSYLHEVIDWGSIQYIKWPHSGRTFRSGISLGVS